MPDPAAAGPVGELLARYQPDGPAEAADLERIVAMTQTAADPWRRDIPLHVTGSALIGHPARGRVLLRWLSFREAFELTAEDNLRETLARAERLVAASPGVTPAQ